MTDVLDPIELPLDDPAPPVRATERRPLLGLAALSAGAGLIHAALTPSHMGEWATEGVAFALVAWAQLGLAGAFLLRRRSLTLLQLAVVLNLVLIGTWAVSRTVGLPGGPESGTAEAVGFVDGVCVALEAALVLAAIAAIAAPRRRRTSGRALAAVVPIAAVVLTTAALLSPSARNHAHAESAGHGHTHAASGDDKGFSLLHNGHHAEFVAYDLDPASQRLLDQQLALTREVARRYPTVAAAEAGGYRRAGPYAPGLGAHYVLMTGEGLNPDGVLDRDDLLRPLSLQFDGVRPTSKIAGFMYYSSSATEPEGFVGRNDVWHYHTSICLKFADGHVDAPFGADKEATRAQCASVGGQLLKQTQWMLHVWSVPGYANPDGVFGENNRKLTCSDGTYYELPPDQWATHLTNICRAAA